jgi:hypothetical protein
MPSETGTYLLGSCRHELEFIRYGIGLLRGNSTQQYSIHTGMDQNHLHPTAFTMDSVVGTIFWLESHVPSHRLHSPG